MPLTDAKIRSAKAGEYDSWLSDRDGLYLRVTPKGAKTFYIRRKNGKNRIQKSLGRWPRLTLQDARKKAEAFNPDASEAQGMTVSEVLDRYENQYINKRHKNPKMFRTYKKAIVDKYGHREAADLETAHCATLISSYSVGRGKRSGDALRSTLKSAFGWALENGFVKINPAAGITSRVSGYTYRPRERVLSDDEIRAAWNWKSEHSRLLRSLLLSGLRIGELQKSQDTDVETVPAGLTHWRGRDFSSHQVLSIPAENSKNGDAHWVLVTDLLAEQFSNHGGYLFTRRSATATQSAVKRFCERQGIVPWTPHDLRRTFATRLHGLGVAPHVVEKMLNHRMQGVMAVYNHAEYRPERIEAYLLWEETILSILEEQRS